MDRETKTIIKCKIMLYPKLQKEIAEQIADISSKTGGIGIGGGKSSAKGIKGWDVALIGVMSEDDYLWCKAVEDAVKYYKERSRDDVVDTIETLYWKNKGNADFVAIKSHMSRRSVYNCVDLFMDTVHKFALKNGINIDV